MYIHITVNILVVIMIVIILTSDHSNHILALLLAVGRLRQRLGPGDRRRHLGHRGQHEVHRLGAAQRDPNPQKSDLIYP